MQKIEEVKQIHTLTPRKKINTTSSTSNINKEEKTTCAICLDSIGKKNSSTTKCGHTFCLTCLHENLKISHRCPCCRDKILDKIPEKPLAKITTKKIIETVRKEIKHYDISYMLEHIQSFPESSRAKLQCDLQEFGLELGKRLMMFQINGNEDDYEEDIEYSSDEEAFEEEDENEEGEEDGDEEENEQDIIPSGGITYGGIGIRLQRTAEQMENNMIVDLIQDTDDEEEQEEEEENDVQPQSWYNGWDSDDN